jgi:hypothetical protein
MDINVKYPNQTAGLQFSSSATPGEKLTRTSLRAQYFKDLADASEVQSLAWMKRGWDERCLEAVGWTARKLL